MVPHMGHCGQISAFIISCCYFHFIFYAVAVIFISFYIRSLKIENENNNAKILTAEVSFMGLGSLDIRAQLFKTNDVVS